MRVVQSGCQRILPAVVRTAYDAPFPDETFKAAAKAMPDLVPTEPDGPASAANRAAFDRGSKGGQDIDLGSRLGGHSRGRVVLTASRASEYSFEGEPVADTAAGSVFTTVLLDGPRSGRGPDGT